MGAGVIPFSLHEGEVHFLFQTTFSGRKAGHLIDFGGGLGNGEDHRQAAIREFVEETETLYFSDNLSQAMRTNDRVKQQVNTVNALFEETLNAQPNWYCQRITINSDKPKDWITFFIEFPYREVETINLEWKNDQTGRFKKKRELFWVSSQELLGIYENNPEKLWKRVRQLDNVVEVIRLIQEAKL
jgi:8-oxo-dGTP pyrophosphatase MutT (NUDIX family)